MGLSSGSALNRARLCPNLANICSALQRCGSASTGIHRHRFAKRAFAAFDTWYTVCTVKVLRLTEPGFWPAEPASTDNRWTATRLFFGERTGSFVSVAVFTLLLMLLLLLLLLLAGGGGGGVLWLLLLLLLMMMLVCLWFSLLLLLFCCCCGCGCGCCCCCCRCLCECQ